MLSVQAMGAVEWRTRQPIAARAGARLKAMQTLSAQAGPTPSDAELIARFAVRDEAALGELFDRYSAAAHGLALSILKDADAAQEIVHDSFLKIWARPQLFDPRRAAFSTFMLTVVRHAAISRLRGVKFTLPLEDEAGMPLPLADERVNLPEATEQRQVAAQVRTGLDALKPAQRETVERAYYRGQTREQIAEAMNVPVGTVKSRLKYALERLRGQLTGLDETGLAETGLNETGLAGAATGEVE